MESPQYHPLYLKGIELFNACEFFESHDAWEELWSDYQGPSRRFYQGLIQVAVALHHFGNGNLGGARKLYHSSRNYLDAYRPRHQGLDVDKLLDNFQRCFAEVMATDDRRADIEVDPELIPEIHLDPP